VDQEDADETLVQRCQRGDGEAFGLLVGRYERVVFGAAFRMLGDAEEARDVAQTAFLKALENLHRFDVRYRFYSWLYRIALNEALDLIARRGRQTELTDVHEANDDPARDATAADLGAHVQRALAGLTPDHRAVIVLRHYQDLSYEEIAQVLELSDQTVKSRLFEARERLRRRLADAGVQA
jgi:RNA polymerase sigma-70 factor (ECF subfamily)